MRRTNRSGFTLIELSIVLVIIGLIIAGVLIGRDLIRAAELRRIYKGHETITAAVNTFRTKYNCIPGDCPNATDFFGDANVCPNLATTDFSTPGIIMGDDIATETCNGDGDGRIDAKSTMYEMFGFWQHMGNAHVIGGEYSGRFATTGEYLNATNSPHVEGLSDRYYWMVADGDASVFLNILFLANVLNGPWLPLVPGHYGPLLVIAGTNSLAPFMSPAEAYSYDMKFDDGIPISGRIIIPISETAVGAIHCTDAADETIQDAGNASAQYLVSDPVYRNQLTCNPMHTAAW